MFSACVGTRMNTVWASDLLAHTPSAQSVSASGGAWHEKAYALVLFRGWMPSRRSRSLFRQPRFAGFPSPRGPGTTALFFRLSGRTGRVVKSANFPHYFLCFVRGNYYSLLPQEAIPTKSQRAWYAVGGPRVGFRLCKEHTCITVTKGVTEPG